MEENVDEGFPIVTQVTENWFVIDSGPSEELQGRRFVMGVTKEGLKEFEKALKEALENFLKKN